MSEAGDPYVYPGTSVLRNRLGITDPDFLDKQERALVVLRSRRGVPRGNFDLNHLRAIHRHLFQDVYDWAGELRTVEISKGDQQFQFRQYIPTGMADVYRRLVQASFLRGSRKMLSPSRLPSSWAISTTSTPSAKGTGAPNSSISSSSPPEPGTPST